MLAAVEVTPLTSDVRVLRAEERTLEDMVLEVAIIPLTELVKVLVAKLRVLVLTPEKLVVESTPFTFEVRVAPLVEVATERVFPVMIEEVPTIPFVLFVMVFPVAFNVLTDITEEVAVTPLIVVVKVLPERD